MKKGTPNHPKTIRLARLLDLPRFAAVGILESLFHFVGEYAPRGDVGRFSDEDIAAAIDWIDAPDRLVDALVASGWCERRDDFRIVVHDWSDHAEDITHRKLARSREFFADGKVPRATRLNRSERESIEADFALLESERERNSAHVCAQSTTKTPCLSLSLGLSQGQKKGIDADVDPDVAPSRKADLRAEDFDAGLLARAERLAAYLVGTFPTGKSTAGKSPEVVLLETAEEIRKKLASKTLPSLEVLDEVLDFLFRPDGPVSRSGFDWRKGFASVRGLFGLTKKGDRRLFDCILSDAREIKRAQTGANGRTGGGNRFAGYLNREEDLNF